jgi:hypothetical protein
LTHNPTDDTGAGLGKEEEVKKTSEGSGEEAGSIYSNDVVF